MKRIVIIVVLGVSASLLMIYPVYTMRGYYCEYTGSTQTWTEWPLGIKTAEAYHKSKLEAFLASRHPGQLKHHWISYQGTDFNMFGRPMWFKHGRPGPLYEIHPFLSQWCDLASDQEKQELCDMLLRENADDIKAAVRAMSKRVEESW